VFAVRFNVEPAHTGLLLPAVGAAGVAFTVTETVDVLIHPDTFTVTVYVPDIAVVALVRIGSSRVEVNPPGPAHE